jgi:hypothetical protein
VTRRAVDALAIRFFWALVASSLVAVFAAGCGLSGSPTADPVSEKELFAVAEVRRFAAAQHENIGGVIVEWGLRVPPGTGGCPATAPSGGCDSAAWYGPPVYFWRPWVNRESTTMSDLTNVAAHEVCHSLTRGHNQLLWNCIKHLGADPQFVPTEDR